MPFGELCARIAAMALRLMYLAQKYGPRLSGAVRKHLAAPGLRHAR
jgi:hypothetical protein